MRSVSQTGSRLKNPLYPTILAAGPCGVESSRRTCQNAVLPDRKAAFPPRAMNPSTVSRMCPDQYSS